MNKKKRTMNKKKTTSLAIALMLMILIASMAYFTDVETGTSEVVAGNVSLTDETKEVNTDLMVPGDTKTLELRAKYTGNVDAKVRVKLSNPDSSVDATETEGFRLNSEEAALDLTEPKFVDAADVAEDGDPIEVDLVLELLAASTNQYQDSTYSVDYAIQVLQDDNVTWEDMTDGTIVAVEKP